MDHGQQERDEELCVPLPKLSPLLHFFLLNQTGMNNVLEIHAESFGNQVETMVDGSRSEM